MSKIIFFTFVCFGLLSSIPVMAACGDNKSQFLAAVLKFEGNIEVWINTRKNWNERESLVDSYSVSERKKVDKIADSVSLCNLAESQYEPCRPGRSVQQIKMELKNACVQIDSDFQTWAEQEIKKQ